MHKDEEIDNFIRSKLGGVNSSKDNFITPSHDFTSRVMGAVALIERRKRWMGYLVAVVLSLAPLAVREIWMIIRGDYFSASSLPMSGFIIRAYDFFLSPAALYILLALGVLAFLVRASRLKRNFNFDFIKIA